MARRARSVVGGEVYHVINRGNCRMQIFRKPEDYLAFMRLMEEGRQRTGMRIVSYCLMPNHWHMVLWPKKAEDLAAFVGWGRKNVGCPHSRFPGTFRKDTGRTPAIGTPSRMHNKSSLSMRREPWRRPNVKPDHTRKR